jgi:tetratricopeptide (TPR) repeat protein
MIFQLLVFAGCASIESGGPLGPLLSSEHQAAASSRMKYRDAWRDTDGERLRRYFPERAEELVLSAALAEQHYQESRYKEAKDSYERALGELKELDEIAAAAAEREDVEILDRKARALERQYRETRTAVDEPLLRRHFPQRFHHVLEVAERAENDLNDQRPAKAHAGFERAIHLLTAIDEAARALNRRGSIEERAESARLVRERFLTAYAELDEEILGLHFADPWNDRLGPSSRALPRFWHAKNGTLTDVAQARRETDMCRRCERPISLASASTSAIASRPCWLWPRRRSRPIAQRTSRRRERALARHKLC